MYGVHLLMSILSKLATYDSGVRNRRLFEIVDIPLCLMVRQWISIITMMMSD